MLSVMTQHTPEGALTKNRQKSFLFLHHFESFEQITEVGTYTTESAIIDKRLLRKKVTTFCRFLQFF